MLISRTSVDFEHAFGTTSYSLYTFFRLPGVGYYIPLYQREYSWDNENIDQLMEDVCQGAEALLDNEETILFLGTVILLPETNPANINPRDPRAVPTRTDTVIDGQQRISTLALLATLLHARLKKAKETLDKTAAKAGLDSDTIQEVSQVMQEIEAQMKNLQEVFSYDLMRGKPQLKPIIIRGKDDCWTLDGSDSNYQSAVANHLASVIRANEDGAPFPAATTSTVVGGNLRLMGQHIDRVSDAHKGNGTFPPAWDILDKMPQEAIWSYKKDKLTEVIEKRSNPITPFEAAICSVVQLLAVVNFLLKRCSFTVIKPTAEMWAFDMFQSLNATGTPLTAIETFRPLIMNTLGGSSFKGSTSQLYLDDVDVLFADIKDADKKTKLTREFLTTFAVVQDGEKLGGQMSAQRRYLQNRFAKCSTAADKEEFVRRMADLAFYRKNVSDAPFNNHTRIILTDGVPDVDREVATLCVAYLKKAGHRMADSILSRFHAVLRRADATQQPQARDEFLAVCKAVAAFYTLWRAASSNSGLDDFYRRTCRVGEGDMCWEGNASALTSANLKQRMRDELTTRNIGNKNAWMNRAQAELRYGNGVDQACRFALLITADDTVSDPAQPGLMVAGMPGVQPYLRLEKWLSPDLSSIEHIAPQNSSVRAPWDATLYDDEMYQRIGNLMLLPLEINISASNKGWMEKCLYYRYLVVQNPAVDRPLLEQEATTQGITLSAATLQRLEGATHIAHIKPITDVGMTGQWNRALVEDRTKRICDLLWERIYPWIQ